MAPSPTRLNATDTGRATCDTMPPPHQAGSAPAHIISMPQHSHGGTATLALQRGDSSRTGFSAELQMPA